MTRYYPDLGRTSDWLNRISHAARLRSTTNQKHYPVLGSDASSVWNFSARFSDVIPREIIDGVAKCRLFSQASIYLRSVFRPLRLELR